tara:strand:- start:4 stop:453 length:450 start_codon:yes stop_codon:yes gene_type:complete
MLIGISPVVGPELLSILHRMGHGDELVLADAHFPGESCGQRVLRSDGLRIADLLAGILPLISLDSYVDSPVLMMTAVKGDKLDDTVESSYRQEIDNYWPNTPAIQYLERYDFYDRARRAFAVVMTGETAKYGNIILRKGVTPTHSQRKG